MSHIFTKRLTKELAATKKSPPDGIKVLESDNLSTWYVQVTTASDSLYQGETFLLRFNFGKEYPMDSPEVEFVTHVPNQDLCILYKIPVHPHIYSNGHICLSILYDQYSPALTASGICLSIVSMLNSNTELVLPPGNNEYVRTAPKSSKKTNWAFHDDKV